MKQLKKRILASMLTALLMVSSVALSACGEQETQKQDTTPAQTGELSSVDMRGETETDNRPTLPAVTYNGEPFRILEREDDASGWWGSTDVYTAELNGETMNDALYYRNLAVEEQFQVQIEPVTVADGSFVTTLRASAAAGDNLCDLAMLTLGTAFSAAQEGFLYPLQSMDQIRMDAAYYTQSVFEDTEILGRNYFAVGDMTIISSDGTWIMMFNKSVVADYGIEDLYQLVRDNKWTMEKYYSLIKDFGRDADGNGVMDQNDVYGLVTSSDSLQGFFYGANCSILTKNDENLPSLAPLTDRTISAAERIDQIMNDEDVTFNYSNYVETVDYDGAQAMFEQGQSLFYAEVLQCVTRLRGMELDFGVLPFPKYDDSQEAFTSYIHSWASDALTIPICTPDTERSQILFEALAYQSQEFLKPAYYEMALKSKAMRDEESGEMLDLILAGRTVDIGYLTDVGGMYSFVIGQLSNGAGQLASNYAKKERAALKALEKMVDRFEGLRFE